MRVLSTTDGLEIFFSIHGKIAQAAPTDQSAKHL